MSARLGSADTRDQTVRLDHSLEFRSRPEPLADLAGALDPAAGASVLAVFELAGADDFRRAHGDEAACSLTSALAAEFARVAQPAGRCYRTRQDELCALFPRPLADVEPVLAAAAIAIRREGAVSLVTTSFGIAVLPAEARDPIGALRIADQHLSIARRTRERRLALRSGL